MLTCVPATEMDPIPIHGINWIMNRPLSIAIIFLALHAPSATYAQASSPSPLRGLLQADGKPSAVAYECRATRENVISCKLTELDVWEPRRSDEESPKPRRNCTFAAHPFEQTFRLSPTDDSARVEWITDTTPNGKCQILRQARFIGRRVKDGIDWEYVAEVKTLKHSAEDGPLRCRDLREIEARYAWRGTPDVEAMCETIRFDAFCYSPDFPCLSGGPPVTAH